MHRCPWCGKPCECDEETPPPLDCQHDCGDDDIDEGDEDEG